MTKKDYNLKPRKKNGEYRSRVHTVACYPDVWNLFNNFKHRKNLSANNAIKLLVNSYLQKDVTKQKNYLISLRDDIQKKINQLN